MHFERNTEKIRQISLTSLIDIVFLLLFFFMLTTSFVRTESMELSFPGAGEVNKKVAEGGLRIFLYDDNRTFLEDAEMPVDELKAQLRLLLFKQPDRGILLLSGERVTVQRLVNVMDDIYLVGGKNVSVAQWDPAQGGPQVLAKAETGAEATNEN